jgi:hypothetical protein
MGGEIAVGWWLVRSVSIYFGVAAPTDPCAAVLFFSHGAGTQFPRNPRAEDVLAELAVELVRLETD